MPGALVADADPDGAILVMDAHCDHRSLEARVGHARHRQQQLAGEKRRLLNHRRDNGTAARATGQYLRTCHPASLSAASPDAKENSQ